MKTGAIREVLAVGDRARRSGRTVVAAMVVQM